MIFDTLIDRLRGKEKTEEVNPNWEVRQSAFFLDAEQHAFFLKHGYCHIKNVVTDDEIKSFEDTFTEISKLDGFFLDEHLLNSGRLHNPAIRQATQNVINKNAATILPRMFDMSKVDPHTGGAFQAKPASNQSDLQIHQDSTVIDETKDYCLFVWIPFCDVTETNGPIWVLPGSHLWGNTQRSLGVPWNFLKHVETLRKFMYPVLVNKGDVLVFDPAMIHCSTPNFSDTLRNAITITVLKKDYQLVYFFKKKGDKSEWVERYDVNEEFYMEYDFESQPDETRFKKTVEKYKPFNLTEKELIRLIKKYSPK